MLRAALALLPLALLAGCGESGEERSSPEPTAVATSTTTPGPEDGRLRLETVAEGLDAPVHVTTAPGDPGRLYVVERRGTVRVIEGGALRAEPFLDIRPSVVSGGERGLLSLAFHPDYAENGRLFVAFTSVNGTNSVVELQTNEERTAANIASARELLAIDDPYGNHNGGQLAFGPDGILYHGTGDGGSGGDPENRAQNLGDRLGKLLRRDVDDSGADWEIVAYGLRNPWRFSFDRETGDLLLGDVGQGSQEEIDFLDWPLSGLVNFGWDVFEGTMRYEDKEPNPGGRLVGPMHTYGRDGGCSVTGGFVYRGTAVPAAEGRYFFGDYCTGMVWSLEPAGGSARNLRREPFTVSELSSFGEDAEGELLLVSLDGTIYRLAS